MSIYATLWQMKFPANGDWADTDDDWIEVFAQAVPPHIGHPSSYPDGDPYASFLPPVTEHSSGLPWRAVVITTEYDEKHGQQYENPLLVLTGIEYASLGFDALYARITNELAKRYDWAAHGWVEDPPGSNCWTRADSVVVQYGPDVTLIDGAHRPTPEVSS